MSSGPMSDGKPAVTGPSKSSCGIIQQAHCPIRLGLQTCIFIKASAFLTPCILRHDLFVSNQTSWILDFCLRFTSLTFFLTGKGQDAARKPPDILGRKRMGCGRLSHLSSPLLLVQDRGYPLTPATASLSHHLEIIITKQKHQRPELLGNPKNSEARLTWFRGYSTNRANLMTWVQTLKLT